MQMPLLCGLCSGWGESPPSKLELEEETPQPRRPPPPPHRLAGHLGPQAPGPGAVKGKVLTRLLGQDRGGRGNPWASRAPIRGTSLPILTCSAEAPFGLDKKSRE